MLIRHIAFLLFGSGFQLLGCFYQTLGSIGTAVQHHVFDTFQHIGRNIRIKHSRGRIDNSHIHSFADSIVKEHRMHGFADIIVPAERE